MIKNQLFWTCEWCKWHQGCAICTCSYLPKLNSSNIWEWDQKKIVKKLPMHKSDLGELLVAFCHNSLPFAAWRGHHRGEWSKHQASARSKSFSQHQSNGASTMSQRDCRERAVIQGNNVNRKELGNEHRKECSKCCLSQVKESWEAVSSWVNRHRSIQRLGLLDPTSEKQQQEDCAELAKPHHCSARVAEKTLPEHWRQLEQREQRKGIQIVVVLTLDEHHQTHTDLRLLHFDQRKNNNHGYLHRTS